MCSRLADEQGAVLAAGGGGDPLPLELSSLPGDLGADLGADLSRSLLLEEEGEEEGEEAEEEEEMRRRR